MFQSKFKGHLSLISDLSPLNEIPSIQKTYKRNELHCDELIKKYCTQYRMGRMLTHIPQTNCK